MSAISLINTSISFTSFDEDKHYSYGVEFAVYHAGSLWKVFYSKPISQAEAFAIEAELHLEYEGISIISEELTIGRIAEIEFRSSKL